MMQVIKQSRDEKIVMYMKLTKREIVEMLVNANDALDNAFNRPRVGQWVDSTSNQAIEIKLFDAAHLGL